MKVPEHIKIITEQIEAMRADHHDKNTRISIQLDALEYGAAAIIIADQDYPEVPPGTFKQK